MFEMGVLDLLTQETIGFACLPKANSAWILLGIPFDSTTTYKPGTRFAPDSVRSASCDLEFYSLLTGLILEDERINDLGNLVLPPGEVEKGLRIIEDAVRELRGLYPDALPIFIGGEHLITYPIVKAFDKTIDTLVVFDAHLDLRSEYLSSKYNHATFLRRIVEELDSNVLHIGSRAYSKDELDYVKSSGVKVFNILESKDLEAVGKEFENLGRTYVSLDFDVIDPAYAPGVGNPEPLGMDPLTLLKVIRKIFESNNKVMGFDLVEVNPLVDVNDVTSALAGKIILEVMAMDKAFRNTKWL